MAGAEANQSTPLGSTTRGSPSRSAVTWGVSSRHR